MVIARWEPLRKLLCISFGLLNFKITALATVRTEQIVKENALISIKGEKPLGQDSHECNDQRLNYHLLGVE